MIEREARATWTELAGRLRPFIARRVRTDADADDVLQDVFLRMQRGLPELHDDERFGPWVYRVTRSAIAEHFRGRARHPVASAEHQNESLPATDDEALDVEQELASYVALFISLLPSPYREALTLTELQGMSQKDAAALLGVSLSGMKSRVQRGRVRLREALDACCEIALDARGRVMSCEVRPDGLLPDCCCASSAAARRL